MSPRPLSKIGACNRPFLETSILQISVTLSEIRVGKLREYEKPSIQFATSTSWIRNFDRILFYTLSCFFLVTSFILFPETRLFFFFQTSKLSIRDEWPDLRTPKRYDVSNGRFVRRLYSNLFEVCTTLHQSFANVFPASRYRFLVDWPHASCMNYNAPTKIDEPFDSSRIKSWFFSYISFFYQPRRLDLAKDDTTDKCRPLFELAFLVNSSSQSQLWYRNYRDIRSSRLTVWRFLRP